jgi:hypothetical protein
MKILIGVPFCRHMGHSVIAFAHFSQTHLDSEIAKLQFVHGLSFTYHFVCLNMQFLSLLKRKREKL